MPLDVRRIREKNPWMRLNNTALDLLSNQVVSVVPRQEKSDPFHTYFDYTLRNGQIVSERLQIATGLGWVPDEPRYIVYFLFLAEAERQVPCTTWDMEVIVSTKETLNMLNPTRTAIGQIIPLTPD